MDIPQKQLSGDRTCFVAPGLRPAAEPPSPRRIAAGVACLVSGFIAVLVGSLVPVLAWLVLAGFMLVLAGLVILRAWGFGTQPHTDDADPRKLYGRSKA
jgi:hypothetical protein